MSFRLSKIFFPTLTGFLVLGGLLELEDKYHGYLFTPHPNFDSGPQIDIPLFFVLIVPFILALIFQALAILPFWNKITRDKQIFRLKLWQIILFISLSFGLVLGLIGWFKDGATKQL